MGGLLVLAFAGVTAWLVAPTASLADEASCNDAIATHALKLQKAHLATFNKCVKFGNYVCPLTGVAIDEAGVDLMAALDGTSSSCRAAVDDQGVPVSAFGPPTCPPVWGGCDDDLYDPPTESLATMATCLQCVHAGYGWKYTLEIDLPAAPPEDPNERKCIRAAVNALSKTIRRGTKAVAVCARGGVKPFTCPADDGPGTALGKGLEQLQRRLAKCRDSTGTIGALSGASATLCDPDATTLPELEACFGRISRCLVCRTANETFGQSQDCAVFSGDPDCRATTPVDGRMYVANTGDDSVTFLDSDGSYLKGTLEASTVTTGAAPSALLADERTNTLFVANRDDGTVTLLDATTGDYVLGTLSASTFPVGTAPSALSLIDWILHVVNEGDDSVTFLNSRSGRPLSGSHVASTFATGSAPRAASVVEHELLIANYDDDTIVRLDARTGAMLGTFATGDGPSALYYDAAHRLISQRRVYVATYNDDTVTVMYASGVPVIGSPFAVGDGPVAITSGVPLERASIVFVASELDGIVTALSGNDMDYAYAALTDSTLALIPGIRGLAFGTDRRLYTAALAGTIFATPDPWVDTTRRVFSSAENIVGMAVDPATRSLYVAHNELAVYGFDATPALSAPTAPFLHSPLHLNPSALALDPAAGLLYMADNYRSAIYILDAVTGLETANCDYSGSYIGGIYSGGVAVNPAAGLAYGSHGYPSARVIYCDSTSGANLGELNIGGFDFQLRVAVNSTLGVVYALVVGAGEMVLADALAPAFLTGNQTTSTVATAPSAGWVTANQTAGLVYVTNHAEDSVTYFDGATGAYLNGTLASSTFPTGDAPSGMALNEDDGILYVANGSDRSITFLDASTGAPWFGTLAASTFSTGSVVAGGGDLTCDPVNDVLYYEVATGRYGLMDALTGTLLVAAQAQPSPISARAGAGPVAIMRR